MQTLIRLGGCPDWSESSPAQSLLLVVSCHGSYVRHPMNLGLSFSNNFSLILNELNHTRLHRYSICRLFSKVNTLALIVNNKCILLFSTFDKKIAVSWLK